jgi:hypothetical protein
VRRRSRKKSENFLDECRKVCDKPAHANRTSAARTITPSHFQAKMKAILAAFTIAMQTLRDKANAALKDMPPLDQFENSREVGFALNTLKYARDEVESMLNRVAEIEAKFEPEVAAAAKQLVEAQVAAGELVRKADVDTAVAAARKEASDQAEAAFRQREAEAATVTARRAEIAATHGAEAAAAVTDDSLRGDDAAYAAFKSEFSRRVTALDGLGVNAKDKPKPFAEIACGIPFDADGRGAFDTRLDSIKELVGTRASAAAAASTPGTGQPPAAAAAASSGSAASAAGDENKVIYGF